MNPTEHLIQTLQMMEDRRTAWLSRAAEQIERWKAEDAANGIKWDSTERDRGNGSPPCSANNAPRTNA